MTQLDERKKKILQAVIKNYLDTGEPVGSRTISKYTDLSLSPATIRNEMSDLEEMGYIFQPHTSAGRIPTDAGYRLYVDEMLEEKAKDLERQTEDLEEKLRNLDGKAKVDVKDEELDKLQAVMDARMDRMEEVLKDMAKLLAANTNYTSLVSMPPVGKNKLKFVQLTKVDEKLLCTIILEGNIVKNNLIELKEDLDQEAVLKLNLLFNNTLAGRALSEINFDMAAEMASQAVEYSDVVTGVLNLIVRAIGVEDGFEIFTSGTTNIFKYPELSDKSRASELISTLEEKKLLNDLMVAGEDGENTGIQVYIGQETPVSSMKDCSVVTATYEFEKGVYGKIGIIGPKRMDYEKVLDALKDVTGSLDKHFEKSKSGKTKKSAGNKKQEQDQ